MSIQLSQENIRRINDLWAIHFKEGAESLCLGCVLDDRYVITLEECEMRLAISFGNNPYDESMRGGFLPPPIHPGKFLLGLHLVATKNNLLTIYDQWMDGFEYGDDGDLELAITECKQKLNAISDNDYLRFVSEGPNEENAQILRGLAVEPEVTKGEAF